MVITIRRIGAIATFEVFFHISSGIVGSSSSMVPGISCVVISISSIGLVEILIRVSLIRISCLVHLSVISEIRPILILTAILIHTLIHRRVSLIRVIIVVIHILIFLVHFIFIILIAIMFFAILFLLLVL